VLQRDTGDGSQIVAFRVETICSAVGSFPRVKAEHRKAMLEESHVVVALV